MKVSSNSFSNISVGSCEIEQRMSTETLVRIHNIIWWTFYRGEGNATFFWCGNTSQDILAGLAEEATRVQQYLPKD